MFFKFGNILRYWKYISKVMLVATTLRMVKEPITMVREPIYTLESIKKLEDQLVREVSRQSLEYPWIVQRFERWPQGTWTTGFVLGCANGLQFRSSLPSEITMIFSQQSWCVDCCLPAHASKDECPKFSDDEPLMVGNDDLVGDVVPTLYESCRHEEHFLYLATMGNRMWLGVTCAGTEWNPWYPLQRLVEEGVDLAVVFQAEDRLMLDDALVLQQQLARELGVPTTLLPSVQ